MDFITRHKRPVIYVIIGLLLAALLWLVFRPPVVEAYRITAVDYIPSLLLSGEVIAEQSSVLSAQAAGKVVDCPVKKGDKVTRGQLLAQIDDSHLVLNRDRAAAAVQAARAQLLKAGSVTLEEARANSVQADLARDKADMEYERIKSLCEAGAVSQVQLEEAERNQIICTEKARSSRALMESLQEGGSSLAVLHAELQQRQLDLAEKELLLAQAGVTAPADGELLDLYVSPGESVSIGTPVVLVASGQGWRVRIQPDQRYAGLAAAGNQAEVWVAGAAATKYEARVIYNEPIANAEQGSITAELEFIGPVPPLHPGQLLSVQLFGPVQPGAIIVPEKYLAVEGGQNGVWLVQEDRTRFAAVRFGTRTADGVLVDQGLKPGDLVLIPSGLKAGQRVTAREEKKS